MLTGCETWDEDICEGPEAPCTEVDTSDGYLPPSVYCETCKKAYERYVDNYDGPDLSFDHQLAASLERRPR